MKPRIIPVIHYADEAQVLRNAGIAFEAGCPGVLLIHMDGEDRLIPGAARTVKDRWPQHSVGINLLSTDPIEAVAISIDEGLDMTWTDAQPTHSDDAPWHFAGAIRKAAARAPEHQVFVGVAFKHQRREPDPARAALRAIRLGFIPTTSGSATGVAADATEIAGLRASMGPDAPLAIASGITPQNAAAFAPSLSHILVATGVSASFHELDPGKLRALVDVVGAI